jgi:hypothetical protein
MQLGWMAKHNPAFSLLCKANAEAPHPGSNSEPELVETAPRDHHTRHLECDPYCALGTVGYIGSADRRCGCLLLFAMLLRIAKTTIRQHRSAAAANNDCKASILINRRSR